MRLSLGSKRKVREFVKGSDLGGKLIRSFEVNAAPEGILTENNIEIHCKLWIDGQLRHNVSDGGFSTKRMCMHLDGELKTSVRKNELATDLGRIFNESAMSDLKISTADTCFLAHKAVLAGKYFVATG